jgi:hypothetical protein
MPKLVSFLADCIGWLKRELETDVDYDWDDGFFLILPPNS